MCRLLSEHIWPDPCTNTCLEMWTFRTFWEERLLEKDPLNCCDHVTATVSQWSLLKGLSSWTLLQLVIVCTSAGYVSLAECRSEEKNHNFWLSFRSVLRKEFFCLFRHHVKPVSVDGCLSALGKTESWESHIFRTEVYDHLTNTFLPSHPIRPLLSSSDPFFPHKTTWDSCSSVCLFIKPPDFISLLLGNKNSIYQLHP